MAMKREIFIEAYLEAALWAEIHDNDNEGESYQNAGFTTEDFADGTRVALERMASKFFERHKLDFSASRTVEAATDLWLTQNRHGAGFWDGDWEEPEAGNMETTARELGEVCLYVGDDGKIYAMGHEGDGKERISGADSHGDTCCCRDCQARGL